MLTTGGPRNQRSSRRTSKVATTGVAAGALVSPLFPHLAPSFTLEGSGLRPGGWADTDCSHLIARTAVTCNLDVAGPCS